MSLNSNVLFSSASSEWRTPQYIFDALNDEFSFELDVAATAENALCERYFDMESNGLIQKWDAPSCWMNPPYSRKWQKHWIAKAKQSVIDRDTKLVCALLPARTDTIMFHEHIYPYCSLSVLPPRPECRVELRFIKGRIQFVGAEDGAPFPSMIVIWYL